MLSGHELRGHSIIRKKVGCSSLVMPYGKMQLYFLIQKFYDQALNIAAKLQFRRYNVDFITMQMVNLRKNTKLAIKASKKGGQMEMFNV